MNTWPIFRRFSCGSVMPARASRKRCAGIDNVQVGVEMVSESLAHFLHFTLAQKAIVHEDTGDLRTDGTQQHAPLSRLNRRPPTVRR